MTPNPQNIGAALLPCPFCGEEAEFSRSTFGVSVECTSCKGSKGPFETEWGAAKCWNLRAPSPDAVGVPEAKPKGNPPYQVEEMDLGPDPLAKGPSEVTQPGEGVDLEAIEKALEEAAWACKLGAELLELAGLDSKDRIEAHKRLFDAYCNGMATLRRESK